jgi:hypothetical protein
MRLIDADKLIHALAKWSSLDYIGGKKTPGQVIDEQPTVFDIDGVLKRLDEEIDLNPISNYEKRISKAYDIVESGKAK